MELGPILRLAIAGAVGAALGFTSARPVEPLKPQGPLIPAASVHPDPCLQGFEALVEEISARPNIRHIVGLPDDFAEFYIDDQFGSVIIVTTAEHPGHPAVISRIVGATSEGFVLSTTACAFGDPAPIEQDLRRYRIMDKILQAEFRCYLCSRESGSPMLSRATGRDLHRAGIPLRGMEGAEDKVAWLRPYTPPMPSANPPF